VLWDQILRTRGGGEEAASSRSSVQIAGSAVRDVGGGAFTTDAAATGARSNRPGVRAMDCGRDAMSQQQGAETFTPG
jgi:hypothetical protein